MHNWISTKDSVPAPDVWVLIYSLGKVGSIGIDVASLVNGGSWMTKGIGCCRLMVYRIGNRCRKSQRVYKRQLRGLTRLSNQKDVNNFLDYSYPHCQDHKMGVTILYRQYKH